MTVSISFNKPIQEFLVDPNLKHVAIVPSHTHKWLVKDDTVIGSRPPLVTNEECSLFNGVVETRIVSLRPTPRYDWASLPDKIALALLWNGHPIREGLTRVLPILFDLELRNWLDKQILPTRMKDSNLPLSDLMDIHRDMARNALGSCKFDFPALAEMLIEAGIATEMLIEYK